MSKEDRRFFDGMLIGAVTVAIVIGLLFVVSFMEEEPLGVSEQRTTTIDVKLQKEKLAVEELPEVTPLPKVFSDRLGETVYIEASSYLVLSYLASPSEERVFRLLLEETDNNREVIEELNDKEIKGCISDGIIFADSSYDYDGPLVFSVWDKEGERLLAVNKEIGPDLVKEFISCLEITRWSGEDRVLLQVIKGDDSTSTTTGYTYLVSENKLQ